MRRSTARDSGPRGGSVRRPALETAFIRRSDLHGIGRSGGRRTQHAGQHKHGEQNVSRPCRSPSRRRVHSLMPFAGPALTNSAGGLHLCRSVQVTSSHIWHRVSAIPSPPTVMVVGLGTELLSRFQDPTAARADSGIQVHRMCIEQERAHTHTSHLDDIPCRRADEQT